MRTTVDLPEDVLRQVSPKPTPEPRVYLDPVTGLAQLDLGRVITMAEVREAMDE